MGPPSYRTGASEKSHELLAGLVGVPADDCVNLHVATQQVGSDQVDVLHRRAHDGHPPLRLQYDPDERLKLAVHCEAAFPVSRVHRHRGSSERRGISVHHHRFSPRQARRHCHGIAGISVQEENAPRPQHHLDHRLQGAALVR